MIAYEELCETLARWREKNGLENGPSAKMPQGPVLLPTLPAAAPAFEPAMGGPAGLRTAGGATEWSPQTDEMHVGQATTIAPNPLAAVPDLDGDPTGLHVPAPVAPAGDSTGEVEDSMFVDDEE